MQRGGYKPGFINMCYSNAREITREDINGKCNNCGHDTIDGEAYLLCIDSETMCSVCGYAPCDGSCRQYRGVK